MDKRDSPFIGALVILVILTIIGVFTLLGTDRNSLENSGQPPQTPKEPASQPSPEPVVDEGAKYFEQRLISLGTEDVGRPIEGFDADLLILAFSGLTKADFNDVVTFDGRYELNGDGLDFVRWQVDPESPAGRTVTSEGFATLLTNVSTRLRMSADTHEDIDAIIARIDVSERIRTMINKGAAAFGISVVPLKLLQDSRCPIDVVCIQAGTVRVQTLVDAGSGGKKMSFTLGKPVMTSAAAVTLERVDPEPRSDLKVDPVDYVFFFKIEKSALVR